MEYRSKEKEIDFLRLLEQLSRIGLEGSIFVCEKVQLSQEMTEINEALLDKIGALKDIVWMVNSKIKSVRTAVELVRSYSKNMDLKDIGDFGKSGKINGKKIKSIWIYF